MASDGRVSPFEQSDAPHGNAPARPRALNWRYLVTGAVVVVLAAAGIVAVTVDPDPESGSFVWPEMTPPETVAAPEGLDESAAAPSADDIDSAIGSVLGGGTLKGDTTAAVLDGFSGETLLETGGTEAVTPASSTKVATSAALLETRGPGYRIPTTVVQGENEGEVVLVAAGDVTLSADGDDGHYAGAASLRDLADQVTEELGGPPKKLLVDTTIFEDDEVADGVDASDLPSGYTARMQPVMLDGGRVDPEAVGSGAQRHEDPVKTVAESLGKRMEMESLDIDLGTAGEDAAELGKVYSPTMQRLSDIALTASDNLLSDALARQAALASGKPGSFAGGAEATVEVMEKLDIPTAGVDLKDGSGLSTKNKLTAEALAGFIQKAVSGDHPKVAGILSGLPVAGFSGTLDDRYQGDSSDGVGKVRAKTGTLSNVSSLTGMVVTPDGRPLAYAFVFNGSAGGNIDEALDEMAANLAQCC